MEKDQELALEIRRIHGASKSQGLVLSEAYQKRPGMASYHERQKC